MVMSYFDIFQLAWRNLWRNQRRTLLTAGGVALTCAVLVFSVSLQLSSYSVAIEASTSILSSHIQVQDQTYLSNPRLRTTINQPSELKMKVLESEFVEAAGIRSSGFAILSSDSRTFGVQLIGVEPENEKKISRIPGLIFDGHFLEESKKYSIVVGKSLATNLKVDIGDELSLLGLAKDGSIAASILSVVGKFESGSPDIDRNIGFMELDSFNEAFGLEDEASYLAIRLKNLQKLEDAITDIAAKISDQQLNVRPWTELIEGLKEAIDLDLASGWLFYLSLIIVVALSIVNTLTMAVLERTKEFGVLMALGARRTNIGILIFIEALLLAAIGVTFGIFIGCLVVYYFGLFGFHIPGSEVIMKVWHMPGILYPTLSLESILRGPRVVFLATLLAAIYPAFKAATIKPLEALNAV